MKKITYLLLLGLSALFFTNGSAWAQATLDNTVIRQSGFSKELPSSDMIILPDKERLIFLGLQTPVVQGAVATTMKDQTIAIFNQLQEKLAAINLSVADIIKLTVYVVGDKAKPADMEGFSKAYKQFFATSDQPNTPVLTILPVSNLKDPSWLVAVEGIAATQK